MLADDLEAELAALEGAAGETEPNDPVEPVEGGEPAADGVEPAKEGAPAEEWKPPSREAYENTQKALRIEREQRRELARQARAQEQNIQAIEQRIQQWQQQQIAAQLRQPAPDPYDNPEAARAWQQQQQHIQQQLWLAQQQREQQERQQHERATHISQLTAAVDDVEGEFRSTHPDYDEATDHILSTQQAILEGMGYAPNVAAQQVNLWAENVAAQAINTGRNLPQTMYDLAQKMGYVPPSKRVQPAQQAAADKLAAIRAGQASSQTLSGGGSGGQGAGPNLKQIASLEGAAFDAAMEKYLSSAIRG